MTNYITTSEETGALFAGLAKAQANMGAVVKDSTNPHFKSRYASLAAVLDAALPPLNDQGIALLQHPGYSEGVVTVTTLLAHSSGQWMKSTVAAQVGKDNAQGVGSAITYLRRYGVQSILGLPVEDDDGAAASRTPPVPRTELRAQAQEKAERQEKAVRIRLADALDDAELTQRDVDVWCVGNNRPATGAMTLVQLGQLAAWLEGGKAQPIIRAYFEAQAAATGDEDEVVVPSKVDA